MMMVLTAPREGSKTDGVLGTRVCFLGTHRYAAVVNGDDTGEVDVGGALGAEDDDVGVRVLQQRQT